MSAPDRPAKSAWTSALASAPASDPVPAPALETDALIVGAGPAGLFLAFQLGLQEIGCQLVDALPEPGGQCAALYAEKPIYDLPGFPICLASELTQRLLQQLRPFAPPMHLGQLLTGLERNPDGRWLARSDGGQAWRARLVFIAAGVGAFVPRKLLEAELTAFEGRQVFYQEPPAALSAGLHGQRVLVLGGGADAIELALRLAHLQPAPARLTLVHRNEHWQADTDLLQQLAVARASARLHVALGQPLAARLGPDGSGGARLLGLELADANDSSTLLDCDLLLPRLGLAPQLGALADWNAALGLGLARKQLPVDPATMALLAQNAEGLYAVGDINHYPGKRKLIVCAFHEATLAAFAAAAQLRPQQRSTLQYTTSSAHLQRLLGVGPAA